MKRIAVLLSSLFVAIFLVACGNQGSGQNADDIPQISAPSQEGNSLHEMESSKNETPSSQGQVPSEESSQTNSENQIQIETESGNIIIFRLNGSAAANDFYNQLPLEIAADNYGSNEKIFYPPNKLNTSDTPMAKGPTGTLAYYEPWGNVAIYYGDCGGADGLYELGNAISGAEHISAMSGIMSISAVSNPLQEPSKPESSPTDISHEDVKNIQVTVGNKAFTATLSDNGGADAFAELLRNEPLVINMRDYSGFEKVGSLGTNLPAADSSITATEGDIILYNADQICVFYGSNSWSYTRLAKIDNLSGWKEALGSGDVTITFSLR